MSCYFYNLTHEARAEIQKYFRSFSGSNENFKICFRDWLTFNIYNVQTIPLTCDDTDNKVMTPRVTLAGTQSTSIQKDTQEMATIRIEGK